MIAYLTEAVLVTLFYTVYCLDSYRFAPRIGETIYRAVVTGTMESMGMFFDTAVIFDISVTIASWNYLRMTDYSKIQSTLASMFVTFPVFVIIMMTFAHRGDWARSKYRIFLVIAFFAIKTGFYSLRWVVVAPDKWKQRAIPCRSTWSFSYLIGPLVVYTFCWFYVISVHLVALRKRWARMNPGWMAPLVVTMWAGIGLFAHNRTASVQISTEDTEWGFGQFLAIYTWALVLLMPVHFSIGKLQSCNHG
jgi:hypothetical protein